MGKRGRGRDILRSATVALAVVVLVDGVLGFRVDGGPSWFVGLFVGSAMAVTSAVTFLIRAPVAGWWTLLLVGVLTPSTASYLPNLLLAGCALVMGVLELRADARKGARAALPPPPPRTGSPF